jgi:DNA-binding transcriptional MocR family regulator
MINLRNNYPQLEQQSHIFEHYLHQTGKHFPNASQALAPWGGHACDRAAAATWLALDSAAQNAMLAMSGNHALLSLALCLRLAGKTVITENFTYGAFRDLAQLLGIRLIACATDDDGIQADALEQICLREPVAALYLQPTLQNPICFTMPLARRLQVAEVAKKNRLVLIEDDAYRFLHPAPPPRMMDMLPQQTFFVSSLTKPFSPALKLAYIAHPLAHGDALEQAIRHSSSGVSPLLAHIASNMLADGVIDLIIKAKRDDAQIRQGITQTILGNAKRQSAPTSYHIWLHLPDHLDADTLCANLAASGTNVSSGTEFAAPNVNGKQRIRFSIGAEADHERLKQGLTSIQSFLNGQAGRSS